MRFGLDGERLRRPPGVWRAGPLMSVLLLVVTLAIMLVTSLVGLELEGLVRAAANLGLLALPLVLWWALYYRPARRMGRLLPRMPTLMILAAVFANGVALPIIDQVYEVDAWLPHTSGLTRIIGYTLIVGFLQEYLKFIIIRFTVYPNALMERADGVAYGVAVSLGFAALLGLRFFIDGGSAPLGPAAARVTSITLSQVAFGAVLGYFFSGARFARQEPPVWWFAVGIAVTALLNGLYIALRGGLIVGSFGIGATANTPLLALLLAVAFALGTFAVLGFLSRQAEIREAAVPGARVLR